MDKYSPEIKEIFDKIDNLTPWDKADLIESLICGVDYDWDKIDMIKSLIHELDYDVIREIAKDFGFVKDDEIDLVSEIENNNLEIDVLDTMTSRDIADYVYEHDDIMDELFHLMRLEDIVSILDNRNKTLKNLLEEINNKTSAITDFVCEKIKNH